MRITEQFSTAADDTVMRYSSENHPFDLRIFISMSVSACEGWPELLVRKRADCSQHLAASDFSSRNNFIRALEAAADKRIEQDTQTHLNRLRKSYKKIEGFAIAVGSQSRQIRPNDLLILVWNVSFAVITFGFSVPLKLKALVDRISYLDERVPHIDTYTEGLADFPALQEPLQAIYTRYIESHLEMIAVISKTNALEKDDIMPFLEESVNQFNQAKKEYSKLREVVEQTARWVYRDKATPPQFKTLGDKTMERGTYSKVDKVQELSTGQLYALKRITTGPGSSQVPSGDWVKNEMIIMRKLSHHHITTLAYSTKDNQGFSLYIMPLAECNLRDYLELSTKSGKYTEKQTYTWFGCLIAALDYAHRSGVKHKDIKPANILIDDNGERILLTDFGLAKDFSDHGVSRTIGPLIVGTPKYLAPECVPEGERTESVDIFALGCVYAEILSFLSGQPLGEFDRKRHEWGGVEFRCCLRDIEHWLNKQKDVRNEGTKNRVLRQTQDMLAKDVIDRPKAAYISEKLTGDGLRCARCPR